MTFADALFSQINDHISRLSGFGLIDDTPLFNLNENSEEEDTPDGYDFEDIFNISDSNHTTNSSYSTSTSTSSVTTPGKTGISDKMFYILSDFEGIPWGKPLRPKELHGYGNDAGHKTYGYGLLYHPTENKFMDQVKSSYTQEELQNLAIIDIKKRVDTVKKWANKNNITLNQNQIDAIVCATHNFGVGFLKSKVARMIANNPNDPTIKDVWAHMSDVQAERQKKRGLKRRRAFEANWYFTGHE